MARYTGRQRSELEEQLKALAVLEGYPLEPSFVGAACRAIVPRAYSPGAVGWTDKLAEPMETDDGQVEVDIPDEVMAKHEGKTVVVDGKPVKIGMKRKDERGPEAKG